MTASRSVRQIMATTDVHSALGAGDLLLGHLHQSRADNLLVDCGDFFEGTGYYRLGQGALEREILLGLYDVIAPGNHGWPHYFEPVLHRRTVCANTVDTASGNSLFRRLRIVEVAGRRTAVTGVIGLQAFDSIPVGQRSGHRATDPVQALRELMLAHHHEVDSWVLLSHSGFEEDLKLAEACPFLDAIFAGHCPQPAHGPCPRRQHRRPQGPRTRRRLRHRGARFRRLGRTYSPVPRLRRGRSTGPAARAGLLAGPHGHGRGPAG